MEQFHFSEALYPNFVATTRIEMGLFLPTQLDYFHLYPYFSFCLVSKRLLVIIDLSPSIILHQPWELRLNMHHDLVLGHNFEKNFWSIFVKKLSKIILTVAKQHPWLAAHRDLYIFMEVVICVKKFKIFNSSNRKRKHREVQ